MCFNPSCKEWTNLQSFGAVPEPRSGHGTAIVRDKAWVYGGYRVDCKKTFSELHELDMHSLTWTQINYCKLYKVQPYYHNFCTLTAVTENQLIMHHRTSKMNKSSHINTWILDLSTMLWRKYPTDADYEHGPRCYHTCTRSINSSVMVIGGEYLKYGDYLIDTMRKPGPCENIHITLEAKRLQHLAIQIIWKHKCTLPWQETLPKKIRSLFDFA